MDFNETPITFILIGLNVIFSIIGFTNNDFLNKTIGWPYYEKNNKEYYRFLSSGFLHADWPHLIFNMITLYSFGPLIERAFQINEIGGSVSFLALYILGLVVANIPSYIKHQNNSGYRSLGASGAVSAVVFAIVIFAPWGKYIFNMTSVLYACIYITYCIYMSRRGKGNINHDAHLWGSLFGLVFTIGIVALIKPEILPAILDEFLKFNILGN
jgi:membrane associated rhomboid family serine protease